MSRYKSRAGKTEDCERNLETQSHEENIWSKILNVGGESQIWIKAIFQWIRYLRSNKSTEIQVMEHVITDRDYEGSHWLQKSDDNK